MNRRKAIESAGMLLGTTLFAPSLLTSCKKKKHSPGSKVDTPYLIAMLDEIADAMLPATPDSPGAREAGCGKVILQIISRCKTPVEAVSFFRLIQEIDRAGIDWFGRTFRQLTHIEKIEVLLPFDKRKEAYYIKLKEMIVYVYFTSEIGMTKALRYKEVPGRYDGCMEYKPGDKAWGWGFFNY